MQFKRLLGGLIKTNPPPLIITRPPGYFTLALDIDNWTGFENIVEWYPEFAIAKDGYSHWTQLPPITDGTTKTEHHPKNLNINYAYRYRVRTKLHISPESDMATGGLPTKYKLPPTGIEYYVVTTPTYIFQIQDAERVVEGDWGTGGLETQKFYMPSSINGSNMVPFALNDVIEVFQLGMNQIEILPLPGTDVVILSDNDRYKTYGRYATIGLRQRDLDVWVASGDLKI